MGPTFPNHEQMQQAPHPLRAAAPCLPGPEPRAPARRHQAHEHQHCVGRSHCVGRGLYQCVGHDMIEPHKLLIQAAARLFADGHGDLARDVRQLALKWTPADERRLIAGNKSTQPTRFLK